MSIQTLPAQSSIPIYPNFAGAGVNQASAVSGSGTYYTVLDFTGEGIIDDFTTYGATSAATVALRLTIDGGTPRIIDLRTIDAYASLNSSTGLNYSCFKVNIAFKTGFKIEIANSYTAAQNISGVVLYHYK